MRGQFVQRSHYPALWFAVVCCLFCSCSKATNTVKVYRVSGVLTVKDAPAPSLVIHFTPEKGRPSTGVTDPKGAFEMRLEKDRAGVIPGAHKVWIEYKPSSPAEEMKIREGNSPLSTELQDALKKYGSAETTPYRVTVDKDQKDLAIKLD
jgi:hypothetical protein